MMRFFAAALAWLVGAAAAFACSSSICPNDPSAVHFDGSQLQLTTKSIANPPESGTTFFASFWYKTTQGELSALFGFDTAGTSGDAVEIQLNTELGTNNLVVAFNKYDGTAVFFSTTGMPFDGNWHSVQVSVDSSIPSGQYALDGVIGDFSVNTQFMTTGTIVEPWPAFVWFINDGFLGGTFYDGDFAELYVWVNNSLPLNSSLVSKFYSSGKAVGLGANCTGPTGSAPNMCNRGDPCDFIFGPRPTGGLSYVLKAAKGASQPLPNGADTDPCLYSDGHGQGCPVQ